MNVTLSSIYCFVSFSESKVNMKMVGNLLSGLGFDYVVVSPSCFMTGSRLVSAGKP